MAECATPRVWTRRRVLATTAAGGGIVVAPSLFASPAASAAAGGPWRATARQIARAASGYPGFDPLLQLLRRATYGPTPATLLEARALGVPGWLDQQLAPTSIDDAACDGMLASYPLLGSASRPPGPR